MARGFLTPTEDDLFVARPTALNPCSLTPLSQDISYGVNHFLHGAGRRVDAISKDDSGDRKRTVVCGWPGSLKPIRLCPWGGSSCSPMHRALVLVCAYTIRRVPGLSDRIASRGYTAPVGKQPGPPAEDHDLVQGDRCRLVVPATLSTVPRSLVPV